jgi:hypothetical protein
MRSVHVLAAWAPRYQVACSCTRTPNHPFASTRYYAARMLPLFQARLMNTSGALGLTLPPLTPEDMLLVPSPAMYVSPVHPPSHPLLT